MWIHSSNAGVAFPQHKPISSKGSTWKSCQEMSLYLLNRGHVIHLPGCDVCKKIVRQIHKINLWTCNECMVRQYSYLIIRYVKHLQFREHRLCKPVKIRYIVSWEVQYYKTRNKNNGKTTEKAQRTLNQHTIMRSNKSEKAKNLTTVIQQTIGWLTC